jgi:hypothetical protein
MPRFFKPADIKIDGYFYIRSDSDYVKFGGRSTVYMSVPDKCVELLKQLGLDLHRKPKEAIIEVEIVEADGYLKLIYTLKPNPAIVTLRRLTTSDIAEPAEVRR